VIETSVKRQKLKQTEMIEQRNLIIEQMISGRNKLIPFPDDKMRTFVSEIKQRKRNLSPICVNTGSATQGILKGLGQKDRMSETTDNKQF
jgi:hypothetical protein